MRATALRCSFLHGRVWTFVLVPDLPHTTASHLREVRWSAEGWHGSHASCLSFHLALNRSSSSVGQRTSYHGSDAAPTLDLGFWRLGTDASFAAHSLRCSNILAAQCVLEHEQSDSMFVSPLSHRNPLSLHVRISMTAVDRHLHRPARSGDRRPPARARRWRKP